MFSPNYFHVILSKNRIGGYDFQPLHFCLRYQEAIERVFVMRRQFVKHQHMI